MGWIERPEFGANVGLIDEIYRQYLDNPDSVSPAWRDFFAENESRDDGAEETTEAGDTAEGRVEAEGGEPPRESAAPPTPQEAPPAKEPAAEKPAATGPRERPLSLAIGYLRRDTQRKRAYERWRRAELAKARRSRVPSAQRAS